jgi:hypothetical protein
VCITIHTIHPVPYLVAYVQRLSVTSPAGDGARLWDRVGIALSGLCAAHCLVTPLALATLSLWPVAFDPDAWVHPLFAALLIPTTLIAMRLAVRRRRPKHVSLLLGIGLLLILAAMLVGDVAGAVSEAAVTTLGSSLLIAGHWRNGHGHDHQPVPLENNAP